MVVSLPRSSGSLDRGRSGLALGLVDELAAGFPLLVHVGRTPEVDLQVVAIEIYRLA